ncbi:MAG TPA: hypothetical protein DCY13_03725 [Verrucomicrobiales bacterium]|nr:hypothetical protein [Verrucomicrobiales bacterium]
MQLDVLEQKLVNAARKHPPGDHVPYAFEKRIMARLAEVGIPDGWFLWSRALWRAAVPCLLLVIFSGLWSSNSMNAANTVDFSQQLENTVLAELNQNLENSW